MKKVLLPLFASAFGIFMAENSSAQTEKLPQTNAEHFCGSTEIYQQLLKMHPDWVQQMNQSNQEIEKTNPQTNQTLMTIPVVFHVLHENGPENISDAQIHDAINMMNLDYQKKNPDTNQIVAAFKGIAASLNIQFKLAQLDPNGNCTNGIERIVTPLTYDGSTASMINQWDPHKYLNIWTVAAITNPSGAAAYSFFPSTAASNPSLDGVVATNTYVGSIGTSNATNAFVLSHETGHWMNLQHTWGSTNNPAVSCGDDGVSDTPITKGWTSCNLTTNDVCNPGTQENVQNFMEYSYCNKMFTQGQSTRVSQAMNSSVAFRSTIWSAGNLAVTGVNNTPVLCQADFSLAPHVVCVGTPVYFTDNSWNGTPTSWQWDFNNDGTVDATIQKPNYTYTAPGTYSVKLTVSDGTTTKSVTKTNYVVVMGNAASINLNYTQDFENTGFPYNDYYVSSASFDATQWMRTTSVAHAGTASATLQDFSQPGDVDEMILPAMDMTFASSPKVTFQVAYAQKNSTANGQLQVYVSPDCGQTWTQKYSKAGSTLSTAGVVSSSFTPSSSQWRLETVNIPNCIGSADCRIKFTFTSDGSANNVYLDDINITESNTGVHEQSQNQFGLQIYPNPVNEDAVILFTLNEKHSVSLSLYDVVGKEVMPLANEQRNAGTYKLTFKRSALPSGIYFVKMNVDGISVTKKMVIQ